MSFPSTDLALQHPLHNSLISQLTTFTQTTLPPLVYVVDQFNPRIASTVIRSIFSSPSGSVQSSGSTRISYAHVNAVACFTPRLFFDTVLNAFADHRPDWLDGATNWSGTGARYNESLDTFLHGIRAVYRCLRPQKRDGVVASNSRSKGKGKARAIDEDMEEKDVQMVLVIERAERIKDALPNLLVPLTRLAEISQTPITTILVSSVPYFEIRPSLGASPDPYYIEIPPPTREGTLRAMSYSFPPPADNSNYDRKLYSPSLHSLYSDYFLPTLLSVCYPFTNDVVELAYFAAATWPGFANAILEQVNQVRRQRNGAGHHDNGEVEQESEEEEEPDIPLDIRMRALKKLTATVREAMDKLVPRLECAADWARKQEQQAMNSVMLNSDTDQRLTRFAQSQREGDESRERAEKTEGGMSSLSRIQKFILLSAFLSSTNPAKSDLRVFGRVGDERRKRRTRKSSIVGSPKKSGGAVKIPQRLLGPISFSLDRLLAILGSLLEENDPPPEAFLDEDADVQYRSGELTELEVDRVAIWTSITELSKTRLLYRTNAIEKLDGPPMYKCGIGYEAALKLAKELGVALNELMWDLL